jgi:hypothetical protein
MAGVKVPLIFRIFKGDQLIREDRLAQPVIKIGKLSSSHLRLDDESVSRMHAVIEVAGPADISIIDLGSTKGTMVNGQKVNKAKLQDGDMIQLGDTRIEFSVGQPESADEMDDAPTKVQEIPAPSAPAPAAPRRVPLVATPPPAAMAPPPAAVAPPPGVAPARAPAAASAGRPAGPAVYGAPSSAARPGNDVVDDAGGARAVEIAAMLDDSVVAVKHVMNPRGGKITSATYGLFGVGAFFCLLAAVGFFQGVSNASFNKKALHEWTEVEKKPLHDFRPRRISLAFDWMAFGGIATGLVAMTLGLIRYRREQDQPYFRIGTSPEVEFPTADAPAPSFALIAPSGDDFVFNFAPAAMEGEMIDEAGTSIPLSELQSQGRARQSATQAGAMEVPIPMKSRFRVRAGAATYMIASVAQPRKHPMPLLGTLESNVMAFFVGSLVVHLGFLFLLFSIPPDPKTLSLDLLGGDGRLSRVQAAPPEEPKQEEEVAEEDEGDDQAGGTGTKMALDEGKMGKKDSNRQSGQYAMKKTHDGDPQLARQAAMDAARTSGILGAFQATQGGAFASITGTGDYSSGLDDRDVYGGLLGNEVGEMQGGWGYGVKGTGPGGGGTGWGTIGTGRYGTIGHGSGTGSGYGVGSGRGGMRGRTSRPPEVRIGNATATGDLDKNIIRRYIRKKLPQIKYCYEKQLLVKTSLAGTVTTNFTISGTGAVIAVAASGIGDSDVENCVAAAIKSIQFPKPKGGGLVNVRYPFTFRSGGD